MTKPILIAGPCAAESKEQIETTAEQLFKEIEEQHLHLDYFRAGVWKTRSHPNSFAGAGEPALSWLTDLQSRFHVPACVEVITPQQIELCEKYDIHAIWVGARTSVNPTDVQKIADAVRHKPFTVMIKNPLVPDMKLWAGNIERFLCADVAKVMAIHRGFSDSSENIYRNAPCWEIPIDLKVLFPELPILCDPSHLCGQTRWIPQIAQIALNYGFNGLMLECHCNPSQALSDSEQQLTPTEWASLICNLTFKTDTPNHDLIIQRTLLNNIDNQLSELLAKRMKVVDEIAEIKKKNNLPVVQPKQWQEVKKRYLKNNQDSQYQDFINNFLELLHQSSINRQK